MRRPRRVRGGLVATGRVALLGVTGAFGGHSTTSAPADQIRLYVPNQMDASVSVVDGAGSLLATVDLRSWGFSEHAMPHQVVAEPDGSAWYVTLVGDNAVARFDRQNRLTARTDFDAPGMVVLDPVRGRLYVSRALAAISPPTRLGVFDASTLELVEEPEIFIARPHALAVDTVSGRVYAGSLAGGQLASYDPEEGETSLSDVAAAPHGFVGLAVSPDGRTVVATTQLNDRLLAFGAADSGPLRPVAQIPVAAAPYDVAFGPEGRWVWFPNQRADAVTRVDAREWTVSATIRHEALAEPHGVVIAPDGSRVFVTSHGRSLSPESPAGTGPDLVGPRETGTVVTIDPADDRVIATAPVGRYAAAPGLALVERREQAGASGGPSPAGATGRRFRVADRADRP